MENAPKELRAVDARELLCTLAAAARRLPIEESRRDDCIQEAAIRFVTGDASWTLTPALAYRLLQSVQIDSVRREQAKKRGGPEAKMLLDEGQVAAPTPDPEAWAIRQQNIARVREALAALPAGERDVTELNLLGLSSIEIGEQLGRSSAAVRALFLRARRRLASALTEEGTDR